MKHEATVFEPVENEMAVLEMQACWGNASCCEVELARKGRTGNCPVKTMDA